MDMPISQILLLFAVLLVGLIILAIGLVRKKRTVEVAGISLLIAVLIAFFVESQEVRDILVSFAIVVVAIISAANINELRKMRKESAEKENRDRKERFLNELIEWLTGVEERILTSEKSIVEGIKEDLANIADEKATGGVFKLENLRMLDKDISRITLLQKEFRGCKYFKEVAFGIDDTLDEQIGKVLQFVSARIAIIVKVGEEGLRTEKIDKEELLKLCLVNKTNIESLNLSEKGLLLAQMSINAGDIREQVNNAISKAVEIKIKLLKI